MHDDKTLPAQIEKLRARFGLSTVVLVIDRGMVTKANLEALAADEIGWITALKAPQIKKLVKDGSLQLSLFDEQNLGEIDSADYPDEPPRRLPRPRSSPKSGRASAKTCCRRPRPRSPRSNSASRPARSPGRPRSRSPSAK